MQLHASSTNINIVNEKMENCVPVICDLVATQTAQTAHMRARAHTHTLTVFPVRHPNGIDVADVDAVSTDSLIDSSLIVTEDWLPGDSAMTSVPLTN